MELNIEIKNALAELRKSEPKKFKQTVDLIINLQKFDLKKTPLNIFIRIPHKAKDKKIAGFFESKSPFLESITEIDFKKYNDRYGHLEGDFVLKTIAQTIRSCMRDPDSAYRYGGDEFVGILPETQEQGAIILSERIRNTVEGFKFMPDSENGVHLTVSIGVAEYKPGEEKEAFMKRADMNMYNAKNNR